MDFTEEQIADILVKYKQQKDRNRERYVKIKDTDEFKELNRSRAKEHYENNKEQRKEHYENNKEFVIARNSYYYYKRCNKLDVFKYKYPDRYHLMEMKNYFKL